MKLVILKNKLTRCLYNGGGKIFSGKRAVYTLARIDCELDKRLRELKKVCS